MPAFRVTYYYFCVPGMENGPDRRDLGVIEQVNAAAALQQVACAMVPDPRPYCNEYTDRDWYRGCLTATDEQGRVTHGRMAWDDRLALPSSLELNDDRHD